MSGTFSKAMKSFFSSFSFSPTQRPTYSYSESKATFTWKDKGLSEKIVKSVSANLQNYKTQALNLDEGRSAKHFETYCAADLPRLLEFKMVSSILVFELPCRRSKAQSNDIMVTSNKALSKESKIHFVIVN